MKHLVIPDTQIKYGEDLSYLTRIGKYIMVCANCHRIIHNEDGYKAHEKRKQSQVFKRKI